MYSSRLYAQDVEKLVHAGVQIVSDASRSSINSSVENVGFQRKELISAKNAKRIRPRIG